MVYSKVKDLPETIQSALSSLGYTRADIELEVKESVSPFIGGGDGYRGFCCILDIVTGERDVKLGSYGGSNAFNPGNQVDCDTAYYKIPANTAVIKGSSGGGKSVFATITFSPGNIIKALGAKPDVSPRDKWILSVIKRYTSAGRKEEFRRNNDIPTLADLKRLEGLGFLKVNKAGAAQITTEGKNVVSGLTHCYHPNSAYYKVPYDESFPSEADLDG